MKNVTSSREYLVGFVVQLCDTTFWRDLGRCKNETLCVSRMFDTKNFI